MIEITEHVRNVLLEVAKNKKIYVEGNFLKLLKAPKGDKEFIEYLKLCKEKDITTRKKRLEVTKQVQKQNGELVEKQKENDSLMQELQVAFDATIKLKEEAEESKDKALEDLEVMQKKTQFELISTIVKVALVVVGELTCKLLMLVHTPKVVKFCNEDQSLMTPSQNQIFI